MTDTSFNVLAAITRATRVGALPPSARLDHPGPPPKLQRPLDSEAMLRSFTAELTALSGTVHRVADDETAVTRVLALLAERGARRILAWDDPWLQPADLGQRLREQGVAIESCWLPATGPERQARLAELDDVLVGVTGAYGALADTGSLVVVSGPGRGRIASLLPPVHIAVVRGAQLAPTLFDFLAANPAIADVGSNVVAITGPSRTGDIEGTLVLGVHGPGEVHVVLIG